MLRAVRSHLSYANVMATVAVFLALGGGAYALSGIPDRGGVFHGCVSNAGGLRVVKSAGDCRRAKTVRRNGRRVRVPGELAVSWNQQGPRGLQGLQGLQGRQGDPGSPGQKATKLFGYIQDATGSTTTATVKYGSGVTGISDPSGNGPYTVTFDRSLTNCVVHATPGFGNPSGAAAAIVDAIPNIAINPLSNDPDQVKVDFEAPNGTTSTSVDTSFVISAFC
jgi:hypothetical protein